jgi:hypothetical protein
MATLQEQGVARGISAVRRKHTATGAAALAERVEVGVWAKVAWVGLKFNAAPTTSEALTITLDAKDGATYDVVLYTVDPSASAMTALSWTPDQDVWLAPGDALAVAYTNTDTKTWGLTVQMESAQ